MGFGERLKTIRGNLKREDFSNKINVHANTIGRWERGEQTPNVDDLNKILAVYPDINPTWLLTGEGEMKIFDYQPSSQRASRSAQTQPDSALMWKVVDLINLVMGELGIDLKEVSYEKRMKIQNLLYEDAFYNKHAPDEKLARILCSLVFCEVCMERKRRERILKPWLSKEEVYLLVKTPPGLKCPIEGKPREYITDSEPVEVMESAYYLRRVDDGSLILIDVKTKREKVEAVGAEKIINFPVE